jgi:hypothetical protein
MVYTAKIKDGFRIELSEKFKIIKGYYTLSIEHSDIYLVSGYKNQFEEIAKLSFLLFRSIKFNNDGSLELYEGDFSEILKFPYKKVNIHMYGKRFSFFFYYYKSLRQSLFIEFSKVPKNISDILKFLNETAF